jgi:hypothetical protein
MTVRFCRECNRETRQWQSDLEPLFPYPRGLAWILLVPVVWLTNLVAELLVNRWRCVECR